MFQCGCTIQVKKSTQKYSTTKIRKIPVYKSIVFIGFKGFVNPKQS